MKCHGLWAMSALHFKPPKCGTIAMDQRHCIFDCCWIYQNSVGEVYLVNKPIPKLSAD